jgi:hypothetical protein
VGALRKLQSRRRICEGLAALAIGCLHPGIVSGQDATEQSVSSQPPPGGPEQDSMLDRMHEYAEQYVSKLPNFLCVQVTHQFQAGKRSKHWSEGDTLTSKLSFNKGHEVRSLELVNGKPAEGGRHKARMPLVTEGEFGILLAQVLGAKSGAAFNWNRWDRLGGKRVAVFDYIVDREHSTLSLSLSDLARAVIPYSGTIYADPGNGTVWRITDTATEIPPALETQQISTTVDYHETQIGSAAYMLPTEATVTLLLKRKKVRNQMEFQGYRKFEADSAITFGASTDSGDQTPAPEQK